MACLEMYNNSDHQHKNHCPPPISPRISFSNDFADSQQILKNHHEIRKNSSSSSSTDFEFSVSNYSMMSADELFCKGRFLPFKNNSSNQTQRTIRDELLAGDHDDHEVSLRPPKGASSARWKGLLGLKRSHIPSKKLDNHNHKILENSSSSSDARRPELPNNSQEYLSTEGDSSNRDVEIGI